MISYAKINFPVAIDSIQKEVGALTSSGWRAHLNAHDYEGEWTVLSLRSPGGSADTITPDLMGYEAYEDTPLMGQCPAIKKLLNGFQCEKLSARLLNLKKGAVIKEHRDRELSFEKGEARLHFPIFTNTGVTFYVNDELVTMLEGDSWYINANLKHRVTNSGDTDRIHLVVDCKVNEWLAAVFEQAEKKYAPDEDEMEHWEQMIPQLRLMGTETALKMAEEMELKLRLSAAN